MLSSFAGIFWRVVKGRVIVKSDCGLSGNEDQEEGKNKLRGERDRAAVGFYGHNGLGNDHAKGRRRPSFQPPAF